MSSSDTDLCEPFVVAVVVTYNRSKLLEECLTALLAQDASVTVLVIDNASTDNTSAVLSAYKGRVKVVRLERNLGGAGGFNVGIRHALEMGAQYVWVMDDDTIPKVDALAALLAADRRARGVASFYASQVQWIDGTLHPMNMPAIDDRVQNALTAARFGTTAVRSCSFVSALFPSEAIREHGLPMADYFIWGDDTEYTMRMTVSGLGVLVPESQVVHKTTYSTLTDPGARFFYAARNNLWTIRFSPGARAHRGALIRRYLYILLYRLKSSRSSVVPVAAARGVAAGLFRRPTGSFDGSWAAEVAASERID